MYKKSKYNIEVDILDNNNILFFNTFTNAYGIMDERTKELYDTIEDVKLENLEIIKFKENINILLKNGYIISKETNELDILKLQSQVGKYMNNKLTLTIAPTLACNMACPYCFEDKKNISMNETVQNNLYNFTEEFLAKRSCKEFHVTWYGGEPLLEIGVIYNLSEKFIELCVEKGIHYTASIITNGVLLEREVAIKLKEECQITMAQITIDGLPEYHNSRRILIDGRDSFDIIVNNIDACKDLLKISVRINVDKTNINNIKKLTEYFLQEKEWHKNPEFYVAPVVEYEYNCGTGNCINGEDYGRLDFEILNLIGSIDLERVKQQLYPSRKILPCTAVQYGSYVVDPDGDLYSCFNVIGNKEKKIGDVKHIWAINNEYIRWLLHEPTGDCLKCNLLPMCAGGCPYEFLLHGKPTCDKITYNFKDRLKLAYNEYIKQKSI